MLTAVVLSNLNPVFGKMILRSQWTPVQMYFVALLVMCVILLLHRIMEMGKGNEWGMTKHDIAGTLMAAIFGGTIAPLLFFEGLTMVSASTSIILSSLLPLFVVVLAVFMLGERFTSRLLAGGALLLASLVALQWENIVHLTVSPGVFLIIASSLCSAFTVIAHKKFVKNRHIDSVILIRTLISTVLVFVWMLLTDTGEFSFLTHPQNIWLVLALPVVSFLIPFFLYYKALVNLTASDAGVMEALGRVFGIIVASTLLKETLGQEHLAALTLATFGVIVINVPLTKWRIVPSRPSAMHPLHK